MSTTQEARGEARDRLAFVLAGGGSLGAVEVGMLRALTEAEVRPDLVVGSSVGAVNAAYFAGAPDLAGVERLAAIWSRIRRGDVFPVGAGQGVMALLGRRSSLLSSRPLRDLLRENLPCQRLEDMAIPCHVVATDLLRGDEVVLSRGSAVTALLASAAIPGVFPPVELDGRHLADGGIASNTPISAAAALGATRVVVLPTGFSCRAPAPPRSALGVSLQALNLLIARQLVVDVEHFRSRLLLRVVPPLCPLARSAYDFSGGEVLIDRAAAATRAWIAEGGLEKDEIPDSLPPHAH